jgi:hypothetical protein
MLGQHLYHACFQLQLQLPGRISKNTLNQKRLLQPALTAACCCATQLAAAAERPLLKIRATNAGGRRESGRRQAQSPLGAGGQAA